MASESSQASGIFLCLGIILYKTFSGYFLDRIVSICRETEQEPITIGIVMGVAAYALIVSKTKSLVVLGVLIFFCTTFGLNVNAQDFDFFYLVQQWPGSFCDTSSGCCYPSTGKPPSDFSIHGLWPNNNDGSYPSNCDPGNAFDASKISDLRNEMNTKWGSLACPSSNGLQFWAHEWEKHGTCSESVLSQHDYFQTALSLKDSVDVLGALTKAGISPDGSQYSVSDIQDAIKSGTGYTAGVECNTDESGNKQLYQIYLCVNSSGSNFINCPVLPQGKCSSSNSQIEFPSF